MENIIKLSVADWRLIDASSQRFIGRIILLGPAINFPKIAQNVALVQWTLCIDFGVQIIENYKYE